MEALNDYFNGLSDKETLLFTSFTLDEAVLVGLLHGNSVPSQQKIVVYHDVLRHRNPGALKAYYPNAIVYSVVLNNPTKDRCPVFHSKIWARVTDKGLSRLAITSANLSQYHLVKYEKSGTLESFHILNSRMIALGKWGAIFYKKSLFPNLKLIRKGYQRVLMDPYSLVIDARKDIEIRAIKEHLFTEITLLGKPQLCAAPFVCDVAIRKYLAPEIKFKVYDGVGKKSGLALHAKVMFFDKCMALGSVNWTAQAMGCLGKTINHETLLITQHDKAVLNCLQKDYTSRPLADKKESMPADEDMEEPLGNNWLEERSARIAAPEQAVLLIRNNHASIELRGKFEGVTWLHLKAIEGDGSILIKLKGPMVNEPKNQKSQHAFATILASGSVLLSGLRNKNSKPTWNLELDYGSYWPSFEKIKKLASTGVATDSTQSARENSSIRFFDVRDIRQDVLNNPAAAQDYVTFNQWLHRHNMGVTPIPTWCMTLANKLTETR